MAAYRRCPAHVCRNILQRGIALAEWDIRPLGCPSASKSVPERYVAGLPGRTRNGIRLEKFSHGCEPPRSFCGLCNVLGRQSACLQTVEHSLTSPHTMNQAHSRPKPSSRVSVVRARFQVRAVPITPSIHRPARKRIDAPGLPWPNGPDPSPSLQDGRSGGSPPVRVRSRPRVPMSGAATQMDDFTPLAETHRSSKTFLPFCNVLGRLPSKGLHSQAFPAFLHQRPLRPAIARFRRSVLRFPVMAPAPPDRLLSSLRVPKCLGDSEMCTS